eukprot:m.212299 g.212299  ORF g.212299 m.212299 type:complete len:52 (+) comp33122_c2_seq1:2611-2766(+)
MYVIICAGVSGDRPHQTPRRQLKAGKQIYTGLNQLHPSLMQSIRYVARLYR